MHPLFQMYHSPTQIHPSFQVHILLANTDTPFISGTYITSQHRYILYFSTYISSQHRHIIHFRYMYNLQTQTRTPFITLLLASTCIRYLYHCFDLYLSLDIDIIHPLTASTVRPQSVPPASEIRAAFFTEPK